MHHCARKEALITVLVIINPQKCISESQDKWQYFKLSQEFDIMVTPKDYREVAHSKSFSRKGHFHSKHFCMIYSLL